MENQNQENQLFTDEIWFLKNDIAFSLARMAEILNNMADGQRLIDSVADDEEILMAQSIIYDQELLVREIMEDVREKQSRIKGFERLSRAGSDHQQPRVDSGTRSEGAAVI